MKKTFVNILVLVAVFAIAWFARGEIAPKVVDNTVTDTVYVDKPYVVTEIKEVEKPITITKYVTERDTVTDVKVEKDTVYVSTLDNTYTYDSRFLTAYPTSPRFLGAEKQGGKLSLTYQRISGDTDEKTWQVGNRGYRIGLSGGEPNIETFRDEKPSFNASIEAGYIRFIKYGGPYVQINSKLNIFGFGINISGNINENPFATAGINYEF